MIADVIRSAAQLLEAPLSEDGPSFFLDAWVFLNPHDSREAPRRQIVQLFAGESGDLLYLSSVVGAYRQGMDLAPLLRAMVGATGSCLYLSGPDDEGVEHLRIAATLETHELGPEKLADRIREVAVFADRFEALLFGADVDLR
ncbi:MAG: hypothetical protein IT378_11825 [Sandaracinaceae bacterium]|nr:hypothetical protein [Sandaracinaceae bacterium]